MHVVMIIERRRHVLAFWQVYLHWEYVSQASNMLNKFFVDLRADLSELQTTHEYARDLSPRLIKYYFHLHEVIKHKKYNSLHSGNTSSTKALGNCLKVFLLFGKKTKLR